MVNLMKYTVHNGFITVRTYYKGRIIGKFKVQF